MGPFRRRHTAAASVQPTALDHPVDAAAPTGPRLLVCDDNNTVAQLLEVMFSQTAWQLDVRSTGEDGLAALDHARPDVVLVDQRMGGVLSGLDTARELRRRGFDRPVLLFSAYLDEQTRQDAKKLAVVPVSKVDFPAVVRHVTAAHAAYRARSRSSR